MTSPPLTLRVLVWPDGRSSEDDFEVRWNGRPVGRILFAAHMAESFPRWRWSITGPKRGHAGDGQMPTSGASWTREEAMVAFRSRWDAWMGWCEREGLDPASNLYGD